MAGFGGGGGIGGLKGSQGLPAPKAKRAAKLNEFHARDIPKGNAPKPKQAKMFQGAEMVGSYKKGGMVKKTGLAKVHAGEKVLTKSQAKKMKK